MMTQTEKQQIADEIKKMKPMQKLSDVDKLILTVKLTSAADALLARQELEKTGIKDK